MICNKDIEMTTYLVCLKGKNFLIDGKKGPSKKQFRSTRLVEAESQKLAETAARELIMKDPRIKDAILNKASDPPLIDLESIKEVPATSYDAQKRAHSLYWENENNH